MIINDDKLSEEGSEHPLIVSLDAVVGDHRIAFAAAGDANEWSR